MSDRFWFRLGVDDANKYDRGQEWFCYNPDGDLADLPASELHALDVAMGGYTVARMLAGRVSGHTQATRAAMWIARRLAGVDEKYELWDPKPLRAEMRRTDPNAPDPDPESAGEGEGNLPAPGDETSTRASQTSSETDPSPKRSTRSRRSSAAGSPSTPGTSGG